MFSGEFCEIFKNTFFYRTPAVAASVKNSPFQITFSTGGYKPFLNPPFTVWSRLIFSRFFYIRGNLGNVKENPNIHLSFRSLTEEIRLF